MRALFLTALFVCFFGAEAATLKIKSASHELEISKTIQVDQHIQSALRLNTMGRESKRIDSLMIDVQAEGESTPELDKPKYWFVTQN